MTQSIKLAQNKSVRERLLNFISYNPEAELKDDEKSCIINKPWGDETIAIRVASEASELPEALNKVRLPPRFTALWHIETKDVEFIYAALKADAIERARQFRFIFNGKEYSCEYGNASEELHLIVNGARFVSPPTDTNYRNLSGLRSFLRFQKTQNEKGEAIPFVLTSFWIRKVELNEEELVNLAKHLNFFMYYFDRFTPRIEIHGDPIKEAIIEQPVRYPFDTFPLTITGRELDPYLLSLWESSVRSSEPLRRFLYNFLIIEYAAFYYLREEIFKTVRRVIASPDMLSRQDEVSRQILDAIVEDRTSDEAKINIVIQQYVDPDSLWKEIEPKAAFFSNSANFDGGFSLPPLIKESWKLEDFKTAWVPKLPDALRKIRNALVHAREQRQSRCILPTSRNQHILRPWAALMSAIALQVILYKDV